MSDQIKTRLKAIRSEVGDAIEIVGVAKLQSIEMMREAIEAGVKILAHNYAQEGEKAIELLGSDLVQWHFIGHIQSRKVKFLPQYDCVQSLDRIEVAIALSRLLEAKGEKIEVFAEVNIGGEKQKSGIAPEQLGEFLNAVSTCPGLSLKGLMTMPPPLEPVESRRPFFSKMKSLFDQYRAPFGFTTLSMGTSRDYPIAVQEGSTMIRLGMVLLGERPND